MRRPMSVLVLGLSCCWPAITHAQAPTAVVNGQVRDTSGAAIPKATVVVINDATNVRYTTETNDEGIYSVPNLPPGAYRIQVSKQGFKTIVHPDIVLRVQDAEAIGFTLPVGPSSDTVTVEGGAPLINTESAAVSTVVDRQFAENLPLNGRSFQSLIQLTPGVVVTPSSQYDGGQFSVNGQRAESNYWSVDGVSANIGTSSTGVVPGNGFAGALGSSSALGGTNSLVSVDALQEFRMQTSTFAPEFGRTPGGQISITTRSGTNQWHGTLFNYLRNDVLDANNWFANEKGLPKPKERQNDFGGTFSGPILKDKTFFFFSYEGLRLRLPQTALTTVPDLNARKNATQIMQPFLNAFPLPNGPEDPANADAAQFNASFSNPATLDAYSMRVDHRLTDKLNLFARYNYSPSELDQRQMGLALSTITSSRITTQTATLGGAWVLSPAATNDLRFNYSRTNALSGSALDSFGGAIPLGSLPLPSPFTRENASFSLLIFTLTNGSVYGTGHGAKNLQRQINVVDNASWQKGSHSLKFGVDFRRLSPVSDPANYSQAAFFADVPSAEADNLFGANVTSTRRIALLFRNLGIFGQDTWRIGSRLTITYGLRWDVDFAPSSTGGPNLLAVTGYNLQDLSNLALAPAGTPPFETRYDNVAPRLGLAYQVLQSQNWQTVIRGGFGVFYDLATSQAGNAFNLCCYPFGALNQPFGPPLGGTATFPLSSTDAAPPPIVPPNASNPLAEMFAFDPHLRLPYALEWNVAVEQALGKQQTISTSYIGSAGRRLLQAATINSPNPNLAVATLFGNTATSDYNALQLQFQRRMSRGLQVLASYTWSHSIDDGSAGSYAENSNVSLGMVNSNANRGPSDFDIRHGFAAAFTYDIPAPKFNAFTNALLRGWSLQNIIQARSAPPVDVSDQNFFAFTSGFAVDVRPDLVGGKPLYLYGAQYPGGRALNPAAFIDPPSGPCPFGSGSCPTRQGTTPRNFLRGFGATQWDFAVHRDFPIRESIKLQFRAEVFNILNHPNFGPPSGQFGFGGFGVSSQTLGQSLSVGFGGNLGGGAFDPLYQLGGPRSMQFALKLIF